MSVNVRGFRSGGWEVDVRITMPDGTLIRKRRKAPVPSKSAAKRWGEALEREILRRDPSPRQRKEVPTLARFSPRFLNGYARANRQKPSGVAAKETILRVHLVPSLGRRRLDAITNEKVQRLKSRLGNKAPKTVKNFLTVLSVLLKTAVEWGVIEVMPRTIRLLKVPKVERSFYDFDEYALLTKAAAAMDARAHVIVLLGGDAGLRVGEMMALEWRDVDLERRQLWVRRSAWRGHVTAPKGGQPRCVTMTRRLTAALRSHGHLRSPRVLCECDGRPLTQKRVQILVRNVQCRRA